MSKPAEYDFAEFDTVSASEKPFEFEALLPSGDPSGKFISVIGRHSARLTEKINAISDEQRREIALAQVQNSKSRPESVKYRKAAEDDAFVVEMAAIRIVGWRGFKVEYSPDAALALCKNAPLLRDQVFDASNDLGNFTTAPSKG